MEDDDKRKFVNNERLKLLATFVNGMAIAVFAVGALAPVISNLYRLNAPDGTAIFALVVCLIGALSLHYVASIILKGLRP